MATVAFYPVASTPDANLSDIRYLNRARDTDWTLPLAIKWAHDLGADVEVYEPGSTRPEWVYYVETRVIYDRSIGRRQL